MQFNMFVMSGVLAAVFGAASAAQAADDEANRRDVRCMAATMIYMGLSTDAQKAMMTPVLYYYQGRIEARDPAFDLAETLPREARLLPAVGLADTGERCRKEAEAATKRLQAAGDAVAGRTPPAAKPAG